MSLVKSVWVAGIKENPIPDNSFVFASVDLSEYVNNNTLNLAEAGIEPDVHEDYFASNEDDLPLADVADIPNEVVLKTYSTERTRHRDLQECELSYNRRMSVINRHKTALAKNIGVRAAYNWTPTTDNAFNKIMNLGANDSIIDAIIELEAFYNDLDITEGLNICLNAKHMARIKKENKNLYKEILKEKEIYGFKLFRYSKNPLYTSAGVKKPFGSVAEATDKRASFTWVTDEVFRCFGDVNMYADLARAGIQADEISFAQRALAGKIRGNNPKYQGVIL
ncbi:hypothetical protein [uncultured Flavobacterium sp.]|uniref:hypothetical protein n=1 Tax=uncultured Flavobacterium sp. TaxID=165435 RepID=UPI0025F85EBE|nr:hypothetical protein [uncultured Flavobacterium sp.]